MTDWSQLTHAYGTAENVPGLLECARPDPENSAWNDLWSCLCHQGTVYSASFAVLPALTQIAREWSAADRAIPLILAGAIVSSTDRPYDQADPFVSHAAEIAELGSLTEDTLQFPGLAENHGTYVYLLQAMLGFQGIKVWSEHLDGLIDEEYEVPCPRCEVENFVVFGQYGYFSTLDDMYMNRPNSKRQRIPLLPEDPAALDGLARQLHTRALADGHTQIAKSLTYVFGSARCAGCGERFRVDHAIVTHWGT